MTWRNGSRSPEDALGSELNHQGQLGHRPQSPRQRWPPANPRRTGQRDPAPAPVGWAGWWGARLLLQTCNPHPLPVSSSQRPSEAGESLQAGTPGPGRNPTPNSKTPAQSSLRHGAGRATPSPSSPSKGRAESEPMWSSKAPAGSRTSASQEKAAAGLSREAAPLRKWTATSHLNQLWVGAGSRPPAREIRPTLRLSQLQRVMASGRLQGGLWGGRGHS